MTCEQLTREAECGALLALIHVMHTAGVLCREEVLSAERLFLKRYQPIIGCLRAGRSPKEIGRRRSRKTVSVK